MKDSFFSLLEIKTLQKTMHWFTFWMAKCKYIICRSTSTFSIILANRNRYLNFYGFSLQNLHGEWSLSKLKELVLIPGFWEIKGLFEVWLCPFNNFCRSSMSFCESQLVATCLSCFSETNFRKINLTGKQLILNFLVEKLPQ